MKLIKPSFEILSQEDGIDGVYKMIELAGRTCYKSEDKITEDSSTKFVQMLIDRTHFAMLEHGTVYLKISNSEGIFHNMKNKFIDNKYSKVFVKEFTKDLSNRGIPFCEAYITTNYRVLIEHDWLEDLQYQCEPTEFHEKRVSVRFICDRGVSHELVRHRVFSFAQESTRFCNYSNDRFGNELTFITPCWIKNIDFTPWNKEQPLRINYPNEGVDSYTSQYDYISALEAAEYSYFVLINKGWKPQEARSVLPNSIKTEVVMTGFVSDWQHFFDLRCSEAAHPQMRELAIPLKEEFIKRKLI